MLGSFEEVRPLLMAFVEAMAQAERSPELREQMAAQYEEARTGVAEMVRESLGGAASADERVLASLLIAICDGLMLQWLLDPAATPTGEELVAAAGAALEDALAGAEAGR
jgi:hypothetical protein